MPAILISARCHQRGELHILRAARWNGKADETVGTATQGYAIENEFNKSIPDEDLRPRDDSADRRTRLRAKIAANPTHAKVTYYRAALATYKWMNDHMISALSEGLQREEYAHYRGIAARKHMTAEGVMNPAYDLKPGDMFKVHADAKDNNEKVMRRYNWKAG
jgi:hypothetical protein